MFCKAASDDDAACLFNDLVALNAEYIVEADLLTVLCSGERGTL